MESPTNVVLPAGDYEVFMSFRGPDVRNRFADHLYTSLTRAKIRTFRDEEELQKGEGIAPSLIQAIPESKIYIPILTEQYAGSKWCLLELAQMVECWKQGKGYLILPIFYFVNPRDVRHQEGPYQQAFEQHAHKHSPQTVNAWKEALREVGQMKGWHVTESRCEGAIVDEIISKVESHLRSMYTLVTDELVGIDTSVEEVMGLLNLESSNKKVVVGIHGMGGLGKTTLSKAVYNKICAQFDRCCYLEDVREALAKSGGAISLQNKVISAILKGDHHVENVSEGVNMIKNRVCKHKLLLVVDNIDENFRFDEILGKLGDFSSGSRFIFTTRYRRSLDFISDCKLYEPREMSPHLSLQLFSKHAFGMENPLEEDVGISEEFVKVATGLPLALKVIGSLLFRRERKFWEEKLIELQGIPSTENMLQERLKISYNDLSHNEKQIFLDIACFFIGRHKDVPYYMWSGCDFYPESGINTLIHRSLIKLDKANQFWMHDHIKDLGRAIVKNEDVRHPYNRSRIWSTDDVLDMLRNREGSERVEAIQIDVESRDYHDKLLESTKFEKLSKLRYLEVRDGRMVGNFSQVLPNICCLRLHNCESIPTDVNTKKLVVLDLEGSNLMDNWKGWSGIKAAAKLKAVDVSYCNLTKSPDLSTCTGFEFLDFTNCRMKGQILIGKFENLKTLRLKNTGITELIIRGSDTGMLRRLEVMDVEGTNLRELPSGMENLSSLKILSLGSTDCMEIPRLPTSLKRLSISCSSRVPNLLELKELESLCYMRADSIWIPGDLWRLHNLKELTVIGSNLDGPLLQVQEATSAAVALPTSLTSLHVQDCPHLKELPSLANLSNLTLLVLGRIGVSEIGGLGELRALEALVIVDLTNLNSVNGLENLLLLTTLKLRSSPLERLPSLANLSKLKVLEVCDCSNLVEIQGLGGVGESLSLLKIYNCPSLADLDGLQHLVALEELIFYERGIGGTEIQSLNLSGLVNLKKLSIRWWLGLLEVKGLERLVSLETLTMDGCISIRQLPDLSKLRNLKELDLSVCQSLIHLTGIQRLELLQRLLLPRCCSITKLPNLSGLTNLETLNLKECVELSEVEGVEGLESLRWLLLSDCSSVTKLPNLSGLKNLEILDLSDCINLTEVAGVEGLESLTRLQLYNCRSITQLGNLSGLKKLEELNIMGCTKLIEVNGLDELKELQKLEMGKRMRVKYLAKSAARYGKRLAGAAPVVGRLISRRS